MPKSDGVTLDASWLKALDALPDARVGNPGRKWTEQEDEAIRRYWTRKRQTDIARILGVSINPLRERARELGVAK